jgi:hypothetical protein
MLATPHPKLFIAQARNGGHDAVDQLVAWLERDRAATDAEVRALLKSWVAEYAPSGEIASAPRDRDAAAQAPLRKRGTGVG